MMTELTVGDAISLVRKNLDEVDINGSSMFSQDGDNDDMDALVKRNLPEAINAVHLSAPAHLLEGATPQEWGKAATILSVERDGICRFSINDKDFLRLTSFRAKDSSIVVTDVLEEASAEGRKQLNKYIRGTFDRPRIVREQGTAEPTFKYYSLSRQRMERFPFSPDREDFIAELSYVQRQYFDGEVVSRPISVRLRQNIVDYITGLVMVAYGDQRAETFFNRASNFNV